MSQSGSVSRNRKIIVLRHGERMDFTFGYSWMKEEYVCNDVNMPESLPARDFTHWRHDTPLTVLGEHVAELVGSSMKSSGVKVSNVFVSPAFRCLQTARGVVKGLGLEKELIFCVEPGLYEWTGFYSGRSPQLLNDEEASKVFNVDRSYQPAFSLIDLENASTETVHDYYDRSFKTTSEILKRCEGDVLIVAHGASLETCTRQLIGKEKRSTRFLIGELINKIPYLGAIAMEQNGNSFELIEPPCLTATHDSSKKAYLPNYKDGRPPQKQSMKYDWRFLLEESSNTN